MSRLIYAPPGQRLPPPKQREAFLRAFFATGSASYAAACAGVDRTTPYVWRAREPEFALAWEAGRLARRTHSADMPKLRPQQMNDRLLELSIRRAQAKRRRVSTLGATLRQARVPTDATSDES